jgi:hypothetical protein
VVDRVELAVGLVRVVHARHSEAQLEAELRIVAQSTGHRGQVLATHEDRHLATVDRHPLDGLGVGRGAADERAFERVGHVVEVAPVGPL